MLLKPGKRKGQTFGGVRPQYRNKWNSTHRKKVSWSITPLHNQSKVLEKLHKDPWLAIVKYTIDVGISSLTNNAKLQDIQGHLRVNRKTFVSNLRSFDWFMKTEIWDEKAMTWGTS